jgi:hypothetical protein
MGSPSPAAAADEASSAREKHLSKAKPPALGGRRGAPVPDLGQTDPNLKKYQEKSGDGGLVKTLLIVLLFVIIAVVLLGVLTLFVPAVRSLLPLGLQQQIEKLVGGAPATATATPEAPRAP